MNLIAVDLEMIAAASEPDECRAWVGVSRSVLGKAVPARIYSLPRALRKLPHMLSGL
jgi:hypothetical protein